jgi:hypothetical protein
MTHEDFFAALSSVIPNKNSLKLIPNRIIKKQVTITVPEALTYLRLVQKDVVEGENNKLWELFDNNSQFLIRRDGALLLDMAFKPFERMDTDLQGNFIPKRK